MIRIRPWLPCWLIPALIALAPIRGEVSPPSPGERPALSDPESLAAAFLADRAVAAEVLPGLADALAAGGRESGIGHEITEEISALGRALSRRIVPLGPPWTSDQVDLLLTTQLVHPLRFVEDGDFRARVARNVLPGALDPSVPPALRDRVLAELNRVRGVDFELSERVELAWGAARRSSADRRLPADTVTEVSIAEDGTIEATLLSLPSSMVAPGEAEALLAALETLDPARQLLVLSDSLMLQALATRPRGANTHLLASHGRAYTPWPRDPLLITHRRTATMDDGVVLIARPNRQPGREADGDLARELVQQLPTLLDRAWGGVGWATATTPFHNGQILLADGAAWVSLHSLEQPILERLGLEQVPVASFETAEGIDAYFGAARQEAEGLANLFDRPVRFVHPTPGGDGPLDRETMRALGGGAGFDLDSLLTLVPGSENTAATALVADLDLGLALIGLDEEGAESLESLRQTYGISAPVDHVRSTLLELGKGPRGRRLDAFLELVVDHLGIRASDIPRRVERLPLLLVPTTLLDGEPLDHRDFLVGWNNVVLTSTPKGRRAEVFAGGLPAGDRLARGIYGGLGVELVLLPPLTGSIVRNGGFRCASNHLRRPADPPSAEEHSIENNMGDASK